MTAPVSAPPDDSGFTLQARDLSSSVITWFRAAYAIGGVVALILGIVLLIWPEKTVTVIAAIVGIDLVVTGVIRVILGIFAPGLTGGHRLLMIVLGLLLLIAGIIALKNLAAAAAALLLLAVVVIGVGWIVDGVLTLVESGGAASRGWAVAFGAISIVAGLVVIVIPTWSAVWLIAFAGIALIVLGVVGIFRGFTFGRELRSTAA